MEPRDLALAHARGRMLVGAGFVLAPGLAGRLWIGGDAARRPAKVLARGFGVRDLALGLGVVIALDRAAPVVAQARPVGPRRRGPGARGGAHRAPLNSEVS